MVSPPDIVGMFSGDKEKKRDSKESKQREKDEKQREKDDGKKVGILHDCSQHPATDTYQIKNISKRLASLGLESLVAAHLKTSPRFIETNLHPGSLPSQPYDLVQLYAETLDGVVHEYDGEYYLLGAINRFGVTCWLDALLFAMFARLETFEPLLVRDFKDLPRQKLQFLLRLWVNLLRRGKLITTDIVRISRRDDRYDNLC
jgi:hypothetical protein